MTRTRRGLEIGAGGPSAAAALDVFTDRLARLASGVDDVVADAERHPDAAALQMAAASIFLFGQTLEAGAEGARWLRRAEALSTTMNEREQRTLAALQRWHANDFLAAIEILEGLLAIWPSDVAALKMLEFLYYVTGQQHHGLRFLACVEALAPANPGDADVLAVWAFAAELAGDPGRALALADEALAAAPVNPWAHHAVSHALLARGNPEGAVERLSGYLPMWPACGRVIHGHNAWHLAVAHLDRLDIGAAWSLHREHVFGFEPDAPAEQIDAIALLWRIEMGGWPVGEAALASVADRVEARVGESFMPFLSAHHAWILARAGRAPALATLLDTVRRRTAADDAEARRVWRPVGLAIVEASAASGGGDFSRSATLLDSVIDRFTSIGGSDAQCDLFRQAYATALVGAGRGADAHRYLERRALSKLPSELDRRLLAGTA